LANIISIETKTVIPMPPLSALNSYTTPEANLVEFEQG